MEKFRLKLKGSEIEYFLEVFDGLPEQIREDIEIERRKITKERTGLNLSGFEVLAIISALNASVSLARMLKEWLKKRKSKEIILLHEGKKMEIKIDSKMTEEEINLFLKRIIENDS